MNHVVDASVALKWFVEEEGSERAVTLLQPGIGRMAPEVVVAELVNAGWRLHKQGFMTAQQLGLMSGQIGHVFTKLHPLGPLAEQAGEMAVTLNHPAYDCFYLALAEQLQLPLITADQRFLASAKQSIWGGRVVFLRAWSVAT